MKENKEAVQYVALFITFCFAFYYLDNKSSYMATKVTGDLQRYKLPKTDEVIAMLKEIASKYVDFDDGTTISLREWYSI